MLGLPRLVEYDFPMPGGTQVPLSRSHRAIFPDRCVSCGLPDPRGEVTIWTIPVGPLSAVGFLSPLVFLFTKPLKIRVPACRPCGWRLRFRRLGIAAGELALIALGCIVARYLFPGTKGLGTKLVWAVFALLFASPLVLWEIFHPAAIDITATGERICYEFREHEYARAFGDLNDQRVVDSAVEDTLDRMKAEFPPEKYVDIFGPLHWDKWMESLERDSKAREELGALIRKAEAEPRSGAKAPIHREILEAVRRDPALKRRVDLEYKIQLAHFLRQVLFRKVPHPEVKSAEWRSLYESLRAILARLAPPGAEGSPGYYLVDDEVDEPGHKIELSKPELLTGPFIREIQKALEATRNEWYVIVQLDFEAAHPKALPGLLTVFRDHVEEALDREQLRDVLGGRFRY
jgi:hypothetical protein